MWTVPGNLPDETIKPVESSSINQKTRCFNPLVSNLLEGKTSSSGERVSETRSPEDEKHQDDSQEPAGEFSSCAANIGMKIFWCAR